MLCIFETDYLFNSQVAEAGIFVVCAGINVAASNELSVIASPEADTVLLVDSVFDLTVDVIQAKVCPGEKHREGVEQKYITKKGAQTFSDRAALDHPAHID